MAIPYLDDLGELIVVGFYHNALRPSTTTARKIVENRALKLVGLGWTKPQLLG
jgi:hypothetical protein